MKLPCQLLLRNMVAVRLFCVSHKQVFSPPLVPGYWEGYISQAGWMEWRGPERSIGSHTAHFTPGVTVLLLWLYLQCSHWTWFVQCTFSASFSKTLTEIHRCKISARLYLVWISCCDDIHVWFKLKSCCFADYLRAKIKPLSSFHTPDRKKNQIFALFQGQFLKLIFFLGACMTMDGFGQKSPGSLS